MLAIIIPCYNEENRLCKSQIIELSAEQSIDIFLVSDGSTDKTPELINAIASKRDNIHSIVYRKNKGKSVTIFRAFHEVYSTRYKFYGYLDADFSTSSDSFLDLYKAIQSNNNYKYIFGSRVSILNNNIKRKTSRHYVGRIVITILNLKYNLGVYDSQCGAKIFNTETAQIAFNNKFSTKWLFDIEIFIRLKQQKLLDKGYEYILNSWRDVEGSKIGFKESFNILADIFRLIRTY